MAVSNKALNDKLRDKYLTTLCEALEKCGEEVLRTGSNEIALPCVDEQGNDKFVVLTVKVPTGSRDGDAYDGYSMAEDYAIKCKNKAEANAKKEAEKAKRAIELLDAKKKVDVQLWLYDTEKLRADITAAEENYARSAFDLQTTEEAIATLQAQDDRLYEAAQSGKQHSEALLTQIREQTK